MNRLFYFNYLLLVGITFLFSCSKNNEVVPVEPNYSQEEFELACEDLLYSTFIEHNDAKITRNFDNIKVFLERDDLPEGIVDSIYNYVYTDYLTYFPNGIEHEIFNYLNSELSNALSDSLKRKEIKTKITIWGKDDLRNLYDHYRYIIANATATGNPQVLASLATGYYRCFGLANAITGNRMLNTSEIKKTMGDCVYGPYDYYSALQRTGYELMRKLILSGHNNDDGENTGGDNPNTGGNLNPNPTPTPPVKTTTKFKQNECVSSILYSIQTGKSSNEYNPNTDKFVASGNFIEKIINFFETSDKLTLTYHLAHIPSNVGMDGLITQTCGTTDGLDIIINESYAKKATNLSIARTMIHETIHAYLNYKVKLIPVHIRINTNEYKALTAIQNEGITGFKNQHHEYMARISHLISDCLYSWAHNNQINVTRDYCNQLSWAGLLNTPTYKKLVKEKYLNDYQIKKTIKNEATNASSAKGSTCN